MGGGARLPGAAVPLDRLTEGSWDLGAEPPEAAADPQPARPRPPQPHSPGFSLALCFGLRGQDTGGKGQSGQATSAQPRVWAGGTSKIAG